MFLIVAMLAVIRLAELTADTTTKDPGSSDLSKGLASGAPREARARGAMLCSSPQNKSPLCQKALAGDFLNPVRYTEHRKGRVA